MNTQWFIDRMQERSTWLSVVAVLGAATGGSISLDLRDQIIAAFIAIAGVIGMVTKDK